MDLYQYKQTCQAEVKEGMVPDYKRMRLFLWIKYACKPQKKKKPKYTNTAPNMVWATCSPFSGSFMEPIMDS